MIFHTSHPIIENSKENRQKGRSIMVVKSDDIDRVCIKNGKKNHARPVLYEKKNLKNVETVNIMKNIITGKISLVEFLKYFGYDSEAIPDKEFLFQITHIARLKLDFREYSYLIKIFGEWNPQYQLSYRSARMFKNMILKTRSGDNFPISSPDELREKLSIFNEISELPIVTYLDILDVASKDIVKNQIGVKQYILIIYLILKCVDMPFEKEVCRRAKNTFFKMGDKEKAHEFGELMNYKRGGKNYE